VATSTCEPEYMALTLATTQWIWFTHAIGELNVLVTNVPIFCDNKAAIDIAYDQKIGDRSNLIDVTYHLVHTNVESGQISLLQVESGENVADIGTNVPPQVTLGKLPTAILDAK
jgi:hypothetical protein